MVFCGFRRLLAPHTSLGHTSLVTVTGFIAQLRDHQRASNASAMGKGNTKVRSRSVTMLMQQVSNPQHWRCTLPQSWVARLPSKHHPYLSTSPHNPAPQHTILLHTTHIWVMYIVEEIVLGKVTGHACARQTQHDQLRCLPPSTCHA